MHKQDPSPICQAKRERVNHTKTQRIHNPTNNTAISEYNHATPENNTVIPTNNTVIPAKAGIQRKTNLPPSISPSQSLIGHNRTQTTSTGNAQNTNQDKPNANPNIDVEAARKSMSRMANIFADIAQHAEESSITRCPYKDARSRCTAKFGCSNQHFTKNPLDQPICTAKDGDLNYRSAWETE